MITRVFGILALVAGVTGATLFGMQEQQPLQPNAGPIMKRKLDAARDIVEGLATEDFQKIGDNAQKIGLLSYEADWNVLQTDTYLRMNSEFRGGVERLRDSADAKNIDAATLAYFEVTLSCVRCHKYLRHRAATDQK